MQPQTMQPLTLKEMVTVAYSGHLAEKQEMIVEYFLKNPDILLPEHSPGIKNLNIYPKIPIRVSEKPGKNYCQMSYLLAMQGVTVPQCDAFVKNLFCKKCYKKDLKGKWGIFKYDVSPYIEDAATVDAATVDAAVDAPTSCQGTLMSFGNRTLQYCIEQGFRFIKKTDGPNDQVVPVVCGINYGTNISSYFEKALRQGYTPDINTVYTPCQRYATADATTDATSTTTDPTTDKIYRCPRHSCKCVSRLNDSYYGFMMLLLHLKSLTQNIQFVEKYLFTKHFLQQLWGYIKMEQFGEHWIYHGDYPSAVYLLVTQPQLACPWDYTQ